MFERFNQTLETMLSAYVSDNHKDWGRQLPYVMMACRATAHETTGFSPDTGEPKPGYNLLYHYSGNGSCFHVCHSEGFCPFREIVRC
jgi:hypothetical protein